MSSQRGSLGGSRLAKLIEELKRELEEAKEIRKRSADWDYIRRLPPRLRIALEFYIETGDFHKARRICNMGVEDFREALRRARVPFT